MLSGRQTDKAWEPSKSQCPYGKLGAIGRKLLLFRLQRLNFETRHEEFNEEKQDVYEL